MPAPTLLNTAGFAIILAVIVIVAWQIGDVLDSPLVTAIVASIAGMGWGWIGREIVWPTGR